LAAIGLPPELAQGSLSFTLGRQNSAEEIPYVAEQLAAVADLLRKMSPLYHQYLKEAQNNA
jgi:cysteine desulfurase